MIDITRHIELFDATTFNTPVHIIGVGATGSWLALFLAKLGITDITVWDYDIVEEHNIANQLFDMEYQTEPSEENKYTGISSDIGAQKVYATYRKVFDATGTGIKTKNEKFTNQRLSGYVFLMVDSMAERKKIWEKAIKMKPYITHLIEPRMGLDLGRIYNVNPTSLLHISKYEETFYGDENAEVSACGASMTVITTAVLIASHCARQLINHFNNKEPLDNEILIDVAFNNIVTETWELK